MFTKNFWNTENVIRYMNAELLSSFKFKHFVNFYTYIYEEKLIISNFLSELTKIMYVIFSF